MVGIFDSGVGGLTVLDAVRRLLPGLSLRYLADGAHFPYGGRPAAEVEARSLVLTGQLVDEGCRLVVVACNTATSAALPTLRARVAVPIVGMEPALKPALARRTAGKVVVLVTPATARGERLARLCRELDDEQRVLVLPMPGLADLVEAGEIQGERIEGMLRRALADVEPGCLVLGCTHYGFLRPLLQHLVGPEVEILDAAEPVARRVQHQLRAHGLEAPTVGPARIRVSTTGDAAGFEATLTRLRAAGGLSPWPPDP